MKRSFLSKLLRRLDHLESGELHTYLDRLAREHGFLEAIFNTLQEGVLVVDRAGEIIYLNHSLQRLIGLSGDSLGSNVRDYIKDLNWDELLTHGGVFTRDVEVFYPAARYLQFYLVPLAGEESIDRTEPRGMVMIFRDMTTLREQTKEVIENERVNAITLLAAGVAHELGNPLNSLHIHLQLIERGLKSLEDRRAEKLWESVRIASAEVSRLDTIIQQFLEAVRPAILQRESTQINQVIRETLNFLEPEFLDREILVETDLNDLPPLLLDAGQIKQALFNLVKNAIQAMDKGGILRVRTDRTDSHLAIEIEDSGKGIPADWITRIFDPYVTSKEKGTGLGLYIVRRILNDHGGELMLESRVEKGTTARIILPLQDRRVQMLTVDEDAV